MIYDDNPPARPVRDIIVHHDMRDFYVAHGWKVLDIVPGGIRLRHPTMVEAAPA